MVKALKIRYMGCGNVSTMMFTVTEVQQVERFSEQGENNHMRNLLGISHPVCRVANNFCFDIFYLALKPCSVPWAIKHQCTQFIHKGFMVQVVNPVICKMLTQVNRHRKFDLTD